MDSQYQQAAHQMNCNKAAIGQIRQTIAPSVFGTLKFTKLTTTQQLFPHVPPHLLLQVTPYRITSSFLQLPKFAKSLVEETLKMYCSVGEHRVLEQAVYLG